jgi:hypothetical protein
MAGRGRDMEGRESTLQNDTVHAYEDKKEDAMI